MTSANPVIAAWATHPVGKVARLAIAVGGMLTATLVLVTASVVSSGSWVLVILGVALAALAVRAARVPTPSRLIGVAMTLLAIPLTFQTF